MVARLLNIKKRFFGNDRTITIPFKMIASENILTNTDAISYLLQVKEGDTMKGVIRTKEVCSVCQDSFIEIKKLGYICPTHKTTPKRFFVDLFYKGQRLKIYSDKQGQPLDTYQRASSLLAHINYELKHNLFDPSHYIKQEQEKFYVTTLLDKFLSYKIDSVAPSYQSHYRRFVGMHKEYFKARDAREIRKIDIINYKEYLEKNSTFSNKTTKNILDNLRTFFGYLKNDLEVIQNIPSFPAIDIATPQTVWLTRELQIKVYDAIPNGDKPLFAFLMLSGCRPGESRALKCRDVNLELGMITISATFSNSVYREKRKGKKSKNAVIPIHPEIFSFIKERVENELPQAFVFVNPRTGRHYPESVTKRIWHAAKKKAGLPENIRLYDATRHSFASQLINQDVSLINVSRLLGHSSLKMTERYAHSSLSKLKIDIGNVSLNKVMTVPNVSPARKQVL